MVTQVDLVMQIMILETTLNSCGTFLQSSICEKSLFWSSFEDHIVKEEKKLKKLVEEVEDDQKVKEVKVTEVETSPTRTLQFSTSVEL